MILIAGFKFSLTFWTNPHLGLKFIARHYVTFGKGQAGSKFNVYCLKLWNLLQMLELREVIRKRFALSKILFRSVA